MDHRSGEIYYPLPRHQSEVDRLDMLHFAVTAAQKSLYLTPVREPKRILDVGCGTGQWARQVCSVFRDADVVGVDIEHTAKPDPPANYHFVKTNVLAGLPFVDGAFDFVHQRFLVAAIPIERWRNEVADVVRVTRPGGWVELKETVPHLVNVGEATRRLADVFRLPGRQAGLDTLGFVPSALHIYLAEAGIDHIQTRTLWVPVGEHGGEIGTWMKDMYRSLLTRMAPLFERDHGLPLEECGELITQMGREIEEHQTKISFRTAFGRRPDT
jgi:ubiquinone/menaquinone biosynthesis C-methylase UbiE